MCNICVLSIFWITFSKLIMGMKWSTVSIFMDCSVAWSNTQGLGAVCHSKKEKKIMFHLFFFHIFSLSLSTHTHSLTVFLTSLKPAILLPQLPECTDYRPMILCTSAHFLLSPGYGGRVDNAPDRCHAVLSQVKMGEKGTLEGFVP